MDTRRSLPLGGVAFVALLALSLLVGGETAEPGASGAEVASVYGENAARHYAGTFVLAAAAPFAVAFALGLTGGSRSAWRHVVRAGATLVAAGILLAAVVHLALVEGADDGLSPAALQALNALDGSTWIAVTSGLGVVMLGAAGLLLPAGPRWLGWPALVLGAALFVPVAGFVAMLVTAVWILVASAVHARATPAAPRAAEATPA